MLSHHCLHDRFWWSGREQELALLLSSAQYGIVALQCQHHDVRKMAPPKKDTHPITLRIEQQLIDQIDALRRQEPDLPTRPEMIRRILHAWMAAQQG